MLIQIIVVVFTLIVLVCAGYILYLKHKKEKYTRERFAFFAVTSIGTLLTTYVLTILGKHGYVDSFVVIINNIFHSNHEVPKIDIRDHILAGVMIAFYMSFVMKIHKNWSGAISESLHEKNRFSETQSITTEFMMQLKDFFNKDKQIKIYRESTHSKNFNIFTNPDIDKIPWYENVYELLSILGEFETN